MLQGDRESGGAQQPVAVVARLPLHGPDGGGDAEAETASTSPGEPGRSGGHRQGRQPGHPRVPVPVPEPALELLHAQLPPGQELVRENRRQRLD